MDQPISAATLRARRLKRYGMLACGMVLLGILLFIVLDPTSRLSVAQRSLVIAETQRGVFHDFVPLHGKIASRETVYLDAQEGGRVERVLVESGDLVQAGQPLVEFGNTALQLDVIEREARLIEQINNLRGTETLLEQTRIANQRALAEIDFQVARLSRTVARRAQLVGVGKVSAEESELAALELEHYKALRPQVFESNRRQDELRVLRLPEVRESMLKLQENLVIARGKLDNLIVRAPIVGRIADFDLKMGQNMERGQRLAQITPDTGFKVEADIDEFYLPRTQVGQKATVTIGGSTWILSIKKVYPQVHGGRFTVDLDFGDDAPAKPVIGQAVHGRLRLGEDGITVFIPSGAFLEESGGSFIFVVAKDGKSAERREIRTGRRNAEQVEVVSGLEPGERVLISDYRGYGNIQRIDID